VQHQEMWYMKTNMRLSTLGVSDRYLIYAGGVGSCLQYKHILRLLAANVQSKVKHSIPRYHSLYRISDICVCKQTCGIHLVLVARKLRTKMRKIKMPEIFSKLKL